MLKPIIPPNFYQPSEVKSSGIEIPKLQIQLETETTENNEKFKKIKLKWKTENKKFLDYSPKIFFYRWKKNLVNGSNINSIYIVKKFYHPEDDGIRTTEWELPTENSFLEIVLKKDDWFALNTSNNIFYAKGLGNKDNCVFHTNMGNFKTKPQSASFLAAFAIVIKVEGIELHGEHTQVKIIAYNKTYDNNVYYSLK